VRHAAWTTRPLVRRAGDRALTGGFFLAHAVSSRRPRGSRPAKRSSSRGHQGRTSGASLRISAPARPRAEGVRERAARLRVRAFELCRMTPATVAVGYRYRGVARGVEAARADRRPRWHRSSHPARRNATVDRRLQHRTADEGGSTGRATDSGDGRLAASRCPGGEALAGPSSADRQAPSPEASTAKPEHGPVDSAPHRHVERPTSTALPGRVPARGRARRCAEDAPEVRRLVPGLTKRFAGREPKRINCVGEKNATVSARSPRAKYERLWWSRAACRTAAATTANLS